MREKKAWLSPGGILLRGGRERKKESLGEYGSGWEWDSTWPKVFDYEFGNNAPAKYINTLGTTRPTINATWVDYGAATSNENKTQYCNIEQTDGILLTSGSQSTNNISCNPHVYNAGNYYNYPSAAPNGDQYVSICPKGWRLPENNGDTSYSNLLLAYGIDFNAGDNRIQPYDAALLNLPLSFLRSGYYGNTGALNAQGVGGYYRMSSLRLYFHSSFLNPTGDTYAYYGCSVRCVSR